MKISSLEKIWERAWNGNGKLILVLSVANLIAMGCKQEENMLWKKGRKELKADYKQVLSYERKEKQKSTEIYAPKIKEKTHIYDKVKI